MSQFLLSDEQVKKALEIDSFRNLSKAKVTEFISSIPMMDKDVAISVVNQFPQYATTASEMVNQLQTMCKNLLESNQDTGKEVIGSYKNILDNCSLLLSKENISDETKLEITKTMVLVADKIAEYDRDNKIFLTETRRDFVATVGGLAICALMILGGRACIKGVA